MAALIDIGRVRRVLRERAFTTEQVGRIGLELEWLVKDPSRAIRRPPMSEVMMALGDLDTRLVSGACVSFEPGGQLELSTQPAPDLASCLRQTMADLRLLRDSMASANLRLEGRGIDRRRAGRLVRSERYDLLDLNYRRFGDAGRRMMNNTASVQVNVDAGDGSDSWKGWRRRWWLANKLGPVLVAMFANSAGWRRGPSRSLRQELRFHTDPTRTDPVPWSGDPRSDWAEYVLDAHVIGIEDQRLRGGATPPPPGLTLRRWIEGAGPRPCEESDLALHLRTVIPPVRARGFLELRMIDAQHDDNWLVPAVAVAAVLDDEVTSDATMELLRDTPWPAHRRDWIKAARDGLTDPVLAGCAADVMSLVTAALPRLGLPGDVAEIVAAFARVYTWQGRCPADDELGLDGSR